MAEYDVCTIMRHYKFYPEDIKVIRDVDGCSKGYCFVDFRSENEAKRLLAQENIESKFGRKLLIIPAIRIRRKEVLVVKQQPTASHALECSASPDLASRGYPSQDHTPTPVVTKSTSTTMYPEPPEGGRIQSLLSDRGVNKLRLNLNLEQVTEANHAAPCNMYSPSYLIPSQPSTPLYPPGYLYHSQPSTPFSDYQYHSLPSTPLSEFFPPYSPNFAQGVQSPASGFTAPFSYGRSVPLAFYQPFYQNSYFSPNFRSQTGAGVPNAEKPQSADSSVTLPVLNQPVPASQGPSSLGN
ncbi:uncharacterized protein LOC134825838 [Bolinopsis microptera]|uniref:uncharacterized protein LOC134825838 n=1 Tax=Bolinopsis microptera TaxID=2820187 RepID=UPI00307A8104